MEAAWPGLAVEESNLSVQIASLRKLLGETPEGAEWIATAPRIGYRFAGRRRAAHGAGRGGAAGGGAVARRPAVREPQSGDRAAIFRRRPGRGHHHAPFAPALAFRLRPQFVLHLSRQAARRAGDRARARRPLRAERQRPALRPAPSHRRAAVRRFDRPAGLGGALRRRTRRLLLTPGRDRRERHRGDRAPALRGRTSAISKPAPREPRRLGVRDEGDALCLDVAFGEGNGDRPSFADAGARDQAGLSPRHEPPGLDPLSGLPTRLDRPAGGDRGSAHDGAESHSGRPRRPVAAFRRRLRAHGLARLRQGRRGTDGSDRPQSELRLRAHDSWLRLRLRRHAGGRPPSSRARQEAEPARFHPVGELFDLRPVLLRRGAI